MRLCRPLAILAFLIFSSPAWTQSAKPFATVNGESISEAQVMESLTKGLSGLSERDKLVLLHQALDAIIEDKLIAAEASADHMTTAQLIDAEIDSNISIPSAEEVEEFYQANKSRIDLPHEQALPAVKQYLIDQQKKRYRDNLIYGLKKKYPVKIFLDPVRTEVSTAGYPTRGAENAKVTIVEFADFECPFCGGLYPTLKLIEHNYSDKVRLVYRQFPLASMHPHAQKAAEASLCANDQKRFWDFYDSMFTGQDRLTVDDLKKRAVDLKLNVESFNTCLDSGAKAAAVAKDADEGRAAGVSGTPAMLINGRFLSGNQPYADIREVIEDELQRTK